MDPRDFYNKFPIGICIVRRDLQQLDVLYANTALLDLMGGAADNLAGQALSDFWPGQETQAFIQKMQESALPQDYILPLSADDQVRWAKLSVTEDVFEKDDVYVLWATDISAGKEAEDVLRQAVNEADAAAEVKSNFLATMSHEIRTPMQTIYGFLELIGEEKPDPKIKTMVDTAKESASGAVGNPG